jgi:hypothetical protein
VDVMVEAKKKELTLLGYREAVWRRAKGQQG